MHNAVKLYRPRWQKVHRLLPSQFPPINLFEQVANSEDLDLIFAIEALTNDRLKEEVGDLCLVPVEDRVSGQGTTPIMAAFTHIGVATRFTDGNYGVYYGSRTLKTALAETIYHREKFLAATQEDDTEITMRCYINQITLALHDIRSSEYHDLHTDDYAPPQAFAKSMRQLDSNGLIYHSVRDAGGECIAVFKPKALTPVVQAGHYKYLWNGEKQKIEHVLEVKLIQ